MVNRRGEISTTMIVTMIILLIGASIIFMVYKELAFSETADTQVCHSSVIMRGSIPEIIKGYIPLKCSTQKICLTNGIIGDKCDDKGEAFAGYEKGIIKAKVGDKKDVERVISQKVIDCWKMMGEGKISVFDKSVLEKYGVKAKETAASCVICSRIAAEDGLEKDITDLVDADPSEYMNKYKIPTANISYMEYLTEGKTGRGATFSGAKLDYSLNPAFGEKEAVAANKMQDKMSALEEGQKEFEELAIIFTQMSTPTSEEVLQNYLVSFGIAGIVGGGATLGGVVKGVSACAANPLVCAGAGIVGLFAAGAIQYNIWNNQALTAAYCGNVTVGEKAEERCSIVRVVKYDAKEIQRTCSFIEGLA